jgi:Domain of unknown function (DUF4337)
MEPQEIREEVHEKLHGHGAREKWINYLALTTVVLAVCATLASFKLEHYSVDSVLNQTKASDMWAFYQAKSIKGYLYEVQKETLELERKKLEKGAPGASATEYDDRIAAYDKNIKRYNQEKADIKKDAEKFEKERDHAGELRETFGVAIIFLQMGILLCSIAALMSKKPVWYFGMLVGAIGVGYFAYGFRHIVH